MKQKFCGAKTRGDGHPCKRPGTGRGGRCSNHGGKSTGPQSAGGRQRISAANRKRWDQWRADNPRLFPGQTSLRQERRIRKVLKDLHKRRHVVHRVDQIRRLINERGVAGIREADCDELMQELDARVEVAVRTDKRVYGSMPAWIRRQMEEDVRLKPLQDQVRALLDKREAMILTPDQVAEADAVIGEWAAMASAVGPIEQHAAGIPGDRVRRYERVAQVRAENELGRTMMARERASRPTSYLENAGTRVRRARMRAHVRV